MRLNIGETLTIEQARKDKLGVNHYRQFVLLVRAIHDDYVFVMDVKTGTKYKIARSLVEKQCVGHTVRGR